MAWGFFRGTGSFWVGRDSIENMLWIYKYTDRTIWVQPLPLTREQKQQVIDKLEHDIQEPYKYYAYDHFWDNCTTRVRDVLNDAIGGKLAAMREPTDGKTFRDLAREGFHGLQMPDPVPDTLPLVITDIAMGRVTDRVPTYWERMFLPQYLREAVQARWGVRPYKLFERDECIGDPDPMCEEHGIPTVAHPSSGRWLFALVIFMLTAPVWITRAGGRLHRTGLAIAVVPYWLLGVALTGLALVSTLPYFRVNEIILVWLPIDLAIVFLPAAWQVTYARARVAMLAVIAILLLAGVLHQPLWVPMLWPAIPMTTVAFWPRRWR